MAKHRKPRWHRREKRRNCRWDRLAASREPGGELILAKHRKAARSLARKTAGLPMGPIGRIAQAWRRNDDCTTEDTVNHRREKKRDRRWDRLVASQRNWQRTDGGTNVGRRNSSSQRSGGVADGTNWPHHKNLAANQYWRSRHWREKRRKRRWDRLVTSQKPGGEPRAWRQTNIGKNQKTQRSSERKATETPMGPTSRIAKDLAAN